jgi:hypothetical protein
MSGLATLLPSSYSISVYFSCSNSFKASSAFVTNKDFKILSSSVSAD